MLTALPPSQLHDSGKLLMRLALPPSRLRDSGLLSQSAKAVEFAVLGADHDATIRDRR